MARYTVTFSVEVDAPDKFEAEDLARDVVAKGTDDAEFIEAERQSW